MARKRTSITLTIVRCGESTWDALGRVHGATDLPLSDSGRNEIIEHARQSKSLKASTIHHPPDEAARDTARIMSATGAKLREVAELADPNLGLLEGMTEEDFSERFRSRYKQWKEDPITLLAPEGENMTAAAERLFNAVARIIRRSRGDEVAIVLHDLGWAMLRCWLADRPLSAMRDLAQGPFVEHYVVPIAALDSLEQHIAETGSVA